MKKVLLLLLVLLITAVGFAQNNKTTVQKKVYVFDIDEEIAPPVTRRMAKAFTQAKEMKADLIVIHMNTYGGLVVDADTIRTRILNSRIPVVVFIDNNAASAGALISIACKKIYMRKSASIGAATVVNQTAAAMPDKYQSYMRATMRSTAEATGRNPKIAEAMVDQDLYVEGVSDSGKVLTFTASEAMQNGFCDGIVETLDDVIMAYGYDSYTISELKVTGTDKVIDFLINPMIHGFLIMIIIGGIYFELQSPGIGFPSAAAVLAAVLYFLPLFLEGFAENWEILVFIIGIILLVVEIFVIPGFGIAGISGIFFIIAGLVLTMVDNVRFDFTNVPFDDIATSFILVVVSIFIALILSYYLTKSIFGSAKFALALNTTQPHEQGFVATPVNLNQMVGKEGVTNTILRPSGKIIINDDEYDAVTREAYIEKGTPVTWDMI